MYHARSSDRLTARLAELFIDVAVVDWQAAGGTRRLAMCPGQSGDDGGFDQDLSIRMKAAALSQPLNLSRVEPREFGAAHPFLNEVVIRSKSRLPKFPGRVLPLPLEDLIRNHRLPNGSSETPVLRVLRRLQTDLAS
jgi:hypothetical protein